MELNKLNQKLDWLEKTDENFVHTPSELNNLLRFISKERLLLEKAQEKAKSYIERIMAQEAQVLEGQRKVKNLEQALNNTLATQGSVIGKARQKIQELEAALLESQEKNEKADLVHRRTISAHEALVKKYKFLTSEETQIAKMEFQEFKQTKLTAQLSELEVQNQVQKHTIEELKKKIASAEACNRDLESKFEAKFEKLTQISQTKIESLYENMLGDLKSKNVKAERLAYLANTQSNNPDLKETSSKTDKEVVQSWLIKLLQED
ncbi:MAG: hypothetical protein AB7F59_13245 [Bdellovibrionales bacterium]